MDLSIDVKNVSFHYPKQKNVLTDISFQLKKHDFAGMIGPNGGGKSTLVRILLGLLQPTSGEVRVFGKHPQEARTRIGYVPQFAKFPRDFPITLHKAISLALLEKNHFWGIFPWAQKASLVETVIQELNLTELKNLQIRELSGGQLQRLLLARALVCEPQLLVLDEPTASVDPGNEFDIMECLKKLSDRMAILIVSHDVGMISSYVQSIICLNHQLSCHPIEHLTPELLQNLYETPVDFIHHHSHTKSC